MSTCAVQEIVSIREEGSPESIMRKFCQKTIPSGVDCRANSYPSERISENVGMYTSGLGENYIFHGVEKDVYADAKVGYATAFATFITKNKLGNVVGGQSVANHRYHPDHLTKVFIWNPDREAVFDWWNKHRPDAAAAKKAAVPAAAIK